MLILDDDDDDDYNDKLRMYCRIHFCLSLSDYLFCSVLCWQWWNEKLKEDPQVEWSELSTEWTENLPT